MFRKEEVEKILAQARRMDSHFDIHGASKHQYKLNSPVDLAFVRAVEKQYHFRLPEDYVQFITEVGDGGAGPSYGMYQFGNIMRKGETPRTQKNYEIYRHSLAKELFLLPLEREDLEDFCCAMEEEFEQHPEKYFAAASECYNNNTDTANGFLVLGTYGCGKDFGLVVTGERRGQVFSVTVEGGYELEADSFQTFYQDWLDFLSDTEQFQKEIDIWRRINNR